MCMHYLLSSLVFADTLQAISSDPTDGTLFSNRSDCWFHLGQGESALTDAKACKKLGQDLAKAYYREGAAIRLLQACSPFLSWNQILPTYIPICSDILIFPSQRFEEAANAFYRGIQIDPNDELITALQYAC
uniref:Ankyrin repeat-containing protein n=1 Tax=Solanum tuberosum TaxID=4113 RepID=M1BPS6_SOLTU